MGDLRRHPLQFTGLSPVEREHKISDDDLLRTYEPRRELHDRHLVTESPFPVAGPVHAIVEPIERINGNYWPVCRCGAVGHAHLTEYAASAWVCPYLTADRTTQKNIRLREIAINCTSPRR